MVDQKSSSIKARVADTLAKSFRGKRVLVTGGLGFIGSSLALRLLDLGAEVTVLDALIPTYGGNPFNLHSHYNQFQAIQANITEAKIVNDLVQGQDLIFHCAGQVSHVLGLSDPYPDLDYTIKGTVVLMEACRHNNPAAKVIKTGTRGQYGPVKELPVSEEAPTNPRGIYEISNLAAEKIMKVYNDVHGVACVLLRLTNIYGPRSQMKSHHFGVANWFIRQAMEDQTIRVFGDGSTLRDFLYIDDCVQAMLLCAICQEARGEVINLGHGRPVSLLDLVKLIIAAAGKGKWEFAGFSAERKASEPGDFYADISKLRRLVGWEPRVGLAEGLVATVDYYRKYRQHYW